MSPRFGGIVSPSTLSVLSLVATVGLARPAAGSLPEPAPTADRAHASAPELKALGTRSYVPEIKRAPTEIRLQNGISFDTRLGEPRLPAHLEARAAIAPDETISLLVQVESPVRTEWVDVIERAGGTVEFFVPNSAFLVRVAEGDRAALEALPFVGWTGPYHPAYRISGRPEMAQRSGRGEYTVLLFDDGDLAGLVERVEFLGGDVVEISDNGINKLARIDLDRGAVESIAGFPDLQWIEPRDRFVVGNSQAQWVDMTNVQNDRKIWDEGLDGTGQVVMVGDSGIRTTHDQFKDPLVSINGFGNYPTHRKIIAYRPSYGNTDIEFGDTIGAGYHGSHTSCTFAGNDDVNGNADARDGLAKGAKIYFLDCGGDSSGIIVPVDLNDYFIAGYDGNAGGAARVSSNSWSVAPQFADGSYTTMSMAADQFAWAHRDFLIAFSSGNAGGVNTVGAPSTAKSLLTSGGTRNGLNAGTIYGATSRGPTDDGRFKPTVCSPAQGVSSANGGTDTGYSIKSGTSMSCPNLAGSATLVRQYFTDGWYPTGAPVAGNEFTPSAALLKAMMVNSGDDDVTSYSVPDNNIGWGRITLDDVLYFPGDDRRTVVLDETTGLVTGEAREYEIWVSDTSEDLKISLVWTDYPSTPAAGTNLVNDLDLVVEEGGNTYLGNVWSSGQSATGGIADGINVEENVRRATPVAGVYTIRVEGANVVFGPQPYAIVVSGGIGGDAGIIALDGSTYGPGNTLGIRVEDTDAGGSVTVTVESSTESTPENFVIAGSDGVYEGSFPLTFVSPASDGQLSISDGDLITVAYTDASPAHTVEATASVIVDDPEITNVAASPSGVTAIISWDTNRPADSQIEFGTTTGLGSFSTLDGSMVTSHSHVVDGLQPETTYYYDVLSRGPEGILVRDDFGGMHYRFTTGRRADVLLVIAETKDIPEPERYADALNATGWAFDQWTKQQAVDPLLGDVNTGMRSYKVVWWQVGWEQYPPFERGPRDSLEALHDGGARIAFVTHDVAWSFSDMFSGFWSNSRQTWFNDVFHATWNSDPDWTLVTGMAGDPISGPYTGGVSYTPHRQGASGDEINLIHGTGTAAYVWENNDTMVIDDIAVRWENGVNNGTVGTAVWGGTPTKTVSMFFEFLNVNAASSSDATRNDILDRTLQWLIGADHPDASVVSPNGGEVIMASPVSISWTASADGANGRSLAATRLEYSDDGGQSWTLITSSPGASPYSWDVSALPTGQQYRVQVVVEDDGAPVLSGADVSDTDFTIAIPGNETRGPVVLAGTPGITPNPIVVPAPVTFTATVSDLLTGGSNVTEAEWSAGGSPSPAGSGTAMSGAFGTVEVAVSANIDSQTLPVGATSLWVRGRDAAGNWGPAQELPVQVNGGGGSDVALGEGEVLRFAMGQNFPNPFQSATRIRLALPRPTDVELGVYNVQGRLVKTLHRGPASAGRHVITWDGRDDGGNRVSSGVYFYRVKTDRDVAEKKMVLLN